MTRIVVHPVIAILVYSIIQTAVELGTEFATVGPKALSEYTKWHWIILLTKVFSSVGLTIKAYLDPSLHIYQNGNGKPPGNPQ